jgi:hypothetical protein
MASRICSHSVCRRTDSAIRNQSLTYQIRAMPDHHMDADRRQLAGAVDDVREHGLTGNRMQDFRQGGAHAGALAGGEDDDIERHRQTLIQKIRTKKKGSQGYPFTHFR